MNEPLNQLLKRTPGIIRHRNGVMREQIDFEDWTRMLTMSDAETSIAVGKWVRVCRGIYKGTPRPSRELEGPLLQYGDVVLRTWVKWVGLICMLLVAEHKLKFAEEDKYHQLCCSLFRTKLTLHGYFETGSQTPISTNKTRCFTENIVKVISPETARPYLSGRTSPRTSWDHVKDVEWRIKSRCVPSSGNACWW